MRAMVGTLALLVLAAMGCTSETTDGEAGACTIPDGGNTLEFEGMCQPEGPATNAVVQVEGAFQPIPGGFQVVAAQETVQMSGPEPAIPAGTLVRLTYGCWGGFYGSNGAVAQIENVPSIDNVANPTEDGSRLWYFMAAGGEARIPEEFPFETSGEPVCRDGTVEDGYIEPSRFTMTGEGFSVTAEPGATETFTATTGPHAGTYTLHNVRITYEGYPGGDAAFDLNFTVARAD